MSRTTVYTPAMLAERWACSERHVRNMIDRGELVAFRLGGKLLRIRGEYVEAFECQNGGSQNCAESSASHGSMEKASGDVIDLEHQTRKRRPASPRLDTPNLRARAGQR
ncbi:excisionase [Aquamicrobium defluvii]|uniref:Excisionase n=1 Tax=Aquamicrobium defluvii TaxID=69279 RepID=A0A011TZP2_9HYPH|nr:excisionase [Aquamicrobium defluvii]EZQ16369.1 excisionase [Halopseudomonas bauzanensis]